MPAATVVIVDDHEGFRRQARALLERDGFEVVGEAADGAEALSVIRAVAPDAVLLDVQLPDMDGFEVVARLGDGPDVVLTSGRSAGDYGVRITTCGVRGFLPKEDLTAAGFRALLAPGAPAQ